MDTVKTTREKDIGKNIHDRHLATRHVSLEIHGDGQDQTYIIYSNCEMDVKTKQNKKKKNTNRHGSKKKKNKKNIPKQTKPNQCKVF